MVQSFRQRVDSKRGRGGERVSAASFHRGRRRGETGTPRLAIGRDGKNARVYDSTRRPIRRNAQTIGRFSARFDRFTDARSIGSKAPPPITRTRFASHRSLMKRTENETNPPSPGRVRTPRGSPSAPHPRAPSSDAASCLSSRRCPLPPARAPPRPVASPRMGTIRGPGFHSRVVKFPWNQNSTAARSRERFGLVVERQSPWGLEGSGSPAP